MLHPLVVLMLVSASLAVPLPSDVNAKIIRYDNKNDGSGNYFFSFETSNGLTREETGTVVNRGLEDEYIEVSGKYKYFDETGAAHVVYYTADKDGFQTFPEGDEPIDISLPSAAVASLLG